MEVTLWDVEEQDEKIDEKIAGQAVVAVKIDT